MQTNCVFAKSTLIEGRQGRGWSHFLTILYEQFAHSIGFNPESRMRRRPLCMDRRSPIEIMNPLNPEELQDAEQTGCCSTENFNDKVADLVLQGENYIQAKPWAVVTGVFLSGLAIGLLLSRREHEARIQDCLQSALKNLNAQGHEKAHAVGDQLRKIGGNLKFW